MRDESWFVDLYERRYGAVLAYGVRRLGTEQGREVASETFLVAWRKDPDLAEDEELPWLYATARRVTANLIRADRRRSALSLRASSAIAAGVQRQLDPMTGVDTVLDVRTALAALSPADQEALLLVEWEGVDHATGARITRCSPNTFKVRVHRARQRLAAALDLAGTPYAGAARAPYDPSGSTPGRNR